jgi:hypothetical protein
MNNNTILAIVFLMNSTLLTTAVTIIVPAAYSSTNDSQTLTNQNVTSVQSLGQNLTTLIEEKFTRPINETSGPVTLVTVVSESPKTIVLFGELITPAQYYNAELWQAVDLLKKTHYVVRLIVPYDLAE